jgi:hypothetical protein
MTSQTDINMRADLIALGEAFNALMSVLPPNALTTMAKNFDQFAELRMAHTLATSQARDDSSVTALEQALEFQRASIKAVIKMRTL